MFGLFNQEPPARIIKRSGQSRNQESNTHTESVEVQNRAELQAKVESAHAMYYQSGGDQNAWKYLQRCITELENL